MKAYRALALLSLALLVPIAAFGMARHAPAEAQSPAKPKSSNSQFRIVDDGSPAAPVVALPMFTQSTPANLPSLTVPSGSPVHGPAELYSGAPVYVQTAPGGGVVVHGGSIAGDVLAWMGTVFAPVASILAGLWFKKFLTRMGIEDNQKLVDKLQEQVKNGVLLAAHEVSVDLKDNAKLDVNVKDQIVGRSLLYVQDHGAETAKALGFDPTDPKFVEAMQARALRAMNDIAAPPPAAAAVLVAPAPVAAPASTV